MGLANPCDKVVQTSWVSTLQLALYQLQRLIVHP